MATGATTSTQFSLNMRDVWKGLLVAILTPVFTIIITSLNAGTLTFDWKAIGGVALAAGLGYILKNFFSQSQVVVSDPVAVEKVKEGETITVKPELK